MIRRWIITIAVVCLAVLGAVAWQRHARTVPWEECSALYRQYAHADGIEATFLRGYRVNDTLSIDVTLLQATDSAGWDKLSHDFNYLKVPSQIERRELSENIDALSLLLKNNRQESPLGNDDIAVASLRDKYLCIFHNARHEEQIIDIIYEKMFKSIETQKKFIEHEENN